MIFVSMYITADGHTPSGSHGQLHCPVSLCLEHGIGHCHNDLLGESGSGAERAPTAPRQCAVACLVDHCKHVYWSQSWRSGTNNRYTHNMKKKSKSCDILYKVLAPSTYSAATYVQCVVHIMSQFKSRHAL